MAVNCGFEKKLKGRTFRKDCQRKCGPTKYSRVKKNNENSLKRFYVESYSLK